MTAYPLIASDSHVVEPPDLWTSRIQGQCKDQAPRLVQEADCDRWYVDQHLNAGSYGVLVDAGKRFDAPETIRFEGRFEDVSPGGYDPDAHVKDMDVDGVAIDILYPSVGLRLFRMPDSQLMSATFRAYNDWLAEFCAAYPQQLKGIAMISVYPREDQQYDHPMYDPFWAAAQDLDMPLSLHVATNRPGAGGLTTDTLTSQTAAARANTDCWVRMSLANMMFAGVFERYLRLPVGAVEHELAWVPFFLSQMDFVYRERRQQARVRFKNGMQPSDFFQSHCAACSLQAACCYTPAAITAVPAVCWRPARRPSGCSGEAGEWLSGAGAVAGGRAAIFACWRGSLRCRDGERGYCLGHRGPSGR